MNEGALSGKHNDEESDAKGAPLQYVAYTRATNNYGTPEQLIALADAYSGFHKAFLVNAILTCGPAAALASTDGRIGGYSLDAVAIALVAVGVGWVTYQPAKNYAIGMGSKPSEAIATSLLLAFQSWLCLGFFGYAIVESRMIVELKKYGVKPGFLGVDRATVRLMAEQMRPSLPPASAQPPSRRSELW